LQPDLGLRLPSALAAPMVALGVWLVAEGCSSKSDTDRGAGELARACRSECKVECGLE